MHKTITLNVNGRDYPVSIDSSETLQDVLRDKLGLTGTKKGCELGVCGACTVIIDGKTMNSCIILAGLDKDKTCGNAFIFQLQENVM